jgi:hypothetical protein
MAPAQLVGQHETERLEARGLKETKASITNKLSRRTLAATFLVATLAALGLEGVRLEDL